MTNDLQERHRRPYLVWLAVAIAASVGITAVGAWIFLNREIYLVFTPQDAPIDDYSVAEPTLLYANVLTGPGAELVAAYASETATSVTLHVELLRVSGPTLAVGLMASEPIKLTEPLGNRTVLNTLGQELREVPYRPGIGTIAETLERWQAQVNAPAGTLVGDVRLFGGPMGEDGEGVLKGEPGSALELEIRDEADGSVRTFETDGQGHYVIPLDPGRYTLLCSPEREIQVEASTVVEADCDRAIP